MLSELLVPPRLRRAPSVARAPKKRTQMSFFPPICAPSSMSPLSNNTAARPMPNPPGPPHASTRLQAAHRAYQRLPKTRKAQPYGRRSWPPRYGHSARAAIRVAAARAMKSQPAAMRWSPSAAASNTATGPNDSGNGPTSSAGHTEGKGNGTFVRSLAAVQSFDLDYEIQKIERAGRYANIDKSDDLDLDDAIDVMTQRIRAASTAGDIFKAIRKSPDGETPLKLLAYSAPLMATGDLWGAAAKPARRA